MIRRLLFCAAFLWPCGGVFALELTLPAGARLTVPPVQVIDSYRAPLGIFDANTVPGIEVKGKVSRAAWRIEQQGLTPLQLTAPLVAQLEDQGYNVVFECADAACGGFDFRFNIDVLPGPNMYVNLRGYRFVTAISGGITAPQDVVTILASAGATTAYVQIIEAGQMDAEIATYVASRSAQDIPDTSSGLLGAGHLVLDDLVFETGTSELGAGPFETLRALADVLVTVPQMRLALVGHTDSVGALEGNIALSKRRADAVRKRLIEAYGVDGARLDAQGVGYLAPISTNDNAAGRQANRRVEAVVLNAP